MASGEWMGCYALTEPSAGSDAMGGTSKAELSDDGKFYILNGQKIYITNGGWADVCITFANVNGKYTAFIIDKDCDNKVERTNKTLKFPFNVPSKYEVKEL